MATKDADSGGDGGQASGLVNSLLVLTSMINMQSLMDEVAALASMTIRNIDERLKMRLRVRAASHGRSMEDEARDILRAALSTETAQPSNLFDAIRARVAPVGGVELEIPPREPMPPPVEFD
jgi:antitoxin FitA